MKHLVWLLFLPGFLCNPNLLTISPDSLVSWKGSCVLIPCKIGQYMGADLRDTSLFWYFQPFFDAYRTDYVGTLLYNSSARNDQARSQSASQPQANFMGNLENKDCSLKISQVRREDTGIYRAILFASYNNHPVQREKWFLKAIVNVAESPPHPRMDIYPKDIREGRTQVTCSVPNYCPEEPLRLTVSGLEQRHFPSQETTISKGVIQTVVSFQVTWEDHGKTLLCSLRGQDGSEISKNTMQLYVEYVPKVVRLIIEEGETLSLECAINSSNPEVAEYLWYKNDQQQYEWQNHEKIEFETKGDRHSGVYRCEAKNSVGTGSSNTVNVDVQSHIQDTSAPAASGPQDTAQGGNQILHSCKDLRSEVFQLADQLQKELLQIRQRTCQRG